MEECAACINEGAVLLQRWISEDLCVEGRHEGPVAQLGQLALVVGQLAEVRLCISLDKISNSLARHLADLLAHLDGRLLPCQRDYLSYVGSAGQQALTPSLVLGHLFRGGDELFGARMAEGGLGVLQHMAVVGTLYGGVAEGQLLERVVAHLVGFGAEAWLGGVHIAVAITHLDHALRAAALVPLGGADTGGVGGVGGDLGQQLRQHDLVGVGFAADDQGGFCAGHQGVDGLPSVPEFL